MTKCIFVDIDEVNNLDSLDIKELRKLYDSLRIEMEKRVKDSNK